MNFKLFGYLLFMDWLTYAFTVFRNTTDADDIQFYLTVYGALAGANSLFTLMRAFLFAYGGICAAQYLHTKLLSVILKVSKLSLNYVYFEHESNSFMQAKLMLNFVNITIILFYILTQCWIFLFYPLISLACIPGSSVFFRH